MFKSILFLLTITLASAYSIKSENAPLGRIPVNEVHSKPMETVPTAGLPAGKHLVQVQGSTIMYSPTKGKTSDVPVVVVPHNEIN